MPPPPRFGLTVTTARVDKYTECVGSLIPASYFAQTRRALPVVSQSCCFPMDTFQTLLYPL